MVNAVDCRSGGLGLSPGWGHCVVFLGETLNSHSASLQTGVKMGTGELWRQPGRMLGSNL